MNIDPILKQFVLEGKIILFFGSGASLGAKNSDGQTMPTTSKLRDLIDVVNQNHTTQLSRFL